MDRVQINARWDRQARELRISKARAKGPAFGHCGETTAWLTTSPARTTILSVTRRRALWSAATAVSIGFAFPGSIRRHVLRRSSARRKMATGGFFRQRKLKPRAAATGEIGRASCRERV